jgi:hypothetical protein
LTIALCLFLFDDKAIRRVLPKYLMPVPLVLSTQEKLVIKFRTAFIAVMAGLIIVITATQIWMLSTRERPAEKLAMVLEYLDSYRVANMYHVFPTMTTERIELEVTGSDDGIEWKKYRFKYKPDDLDQQPGLVMPHQPRLDWQIWFVPLHSKHLPWFEQFVYALLEGAEDVDDLLEHNPFPDKPPRYINVDAYKYTFTAPGQKQQTGRWWNREALGPFLPLPGVVHAAQDVNK